MGLKPRQMREKLKGPLALLPTHFNADESLDLGAMKATTQHAVEQMQDKDGCIMIAGSTSEFYAMTDEESLAMIKTVVETTNEKVPIIAGTGRAATGLTIDMSLKAQDLGIDCAMITNPYYLMTADEGLYRHFSKIAEKLEIGVMVYNNPTTSKMQIPVDIMKRLSKVPNIIASKENATTMEKVYWMMEEIDPEDFTVCCGIGNLYFIYEALLGCKSFVTELICFAPEIAYGMYDAAVRKDFDMMKSWLDKLIPYHKFIGKCVAKRRIPTTIEQEVGGRATSIYQSVLKKSMEIAGQPGGIVREPLENLTQGEIEELRAVLFESGIIS